jgi:excinuclease UvrABC nuclease subunit
MYIGLSKTLHRRLRRYSNRAFRNEGAPQRGAHINIAKSVKEHIEVAIFAKVIPGANEALLLLLETALIMTLRPTWNGTHRSSN